MKWITKRLLLFAVFIFFSCKKESTSDDRITLRGKVVYQGTSIGVPHADVVFFRGEHEVGLYNATECDDSGYFELHEILIPEYIDAYKHHQISANPNPYDGVEYNGEEWITLEIPDSLTLTIRLMPERNVDPMAAAKIQRQINGFFLFETISIDQPELVCRYRSDEPLLFSYRLRVSPFEWGPVYEVELGLCPAFSEQEFIIHYP